jgi:aminotransferase in exopolysaccharide biosynthesis
MYDELFDLIKSIYANQSSIVLHEPILTEHDKLYLNDVIDSGFVSSVGQYVTQFEQKLSSITGAKETVAVVNGTSALHLALKAVGVSHEDEVITQSLTFVATANSIAYCGASPVFIDVDNHTLGMSYSSLKHWLENKCKNTSKGLINRTTGRRVAACLPMHTFGNSCEIENIASLCREFQLPLIEDAAEAMGSYYKQQHLGTFGDIGVVSFNGNKVITTGGGGALLFNDKSLAESVRHLSTTAKVPHPYQYSHDQIGFNYRMPNLNAALGCAQLDKLDALLASKRRVFKSYHDFFNTKFRSKPMSLVEPVKYCQSNHWLNAVIVEQASKVKNLIELASEQNIMLRPAWQPMHSLPMFKHSDRDDLIVTSDLASRLVNLPSSAVINEQLNLPKLPEFMSGN